MFFLGGDDFAPADKAEAARAVNEALVAGWTGFDIAERVSLEEIATPTSESNHRLDVGASWCFSEFRLPLTLFAPAL